MHKHPRLIKPVRRSWHYGSRLPSRASRLSETLPAAAGTCCRPAVELTCRASSMSGRIGPAANRFTRTVIYLGSCQTIRSHGCRSVPRPPRLNARRLRTIKSLLRKRYPSTESLSRLGMTCALFVAAREEPSQYALLPKARPCLHPVWTVMRKSSSSPARDQGCGRADVRTCGRAPSA